MRIRRTAVAPASACEATVMASTAAEAVSYRVDIDGGVSQVRTHRTRGDLVGEKTCPNTCDFPLEVGTSNDIPEGYQVNTNLRCENDKWGPEEARGRA